MGTAESQAYNITAGILMTDVIKTSLGPRGMEKVYVDILGEETITKHGGAFLRKIDVDHPAAKMVVDGVNTVDTHVGDGTIVTAVLIGALLTHSKFLLHMGIPTTTITRGFTMGADHALCILDNIKIKQPGSVPDIYHWIVRSCIEGKAIVHSLLDIDSIITMIVEAVQRVTNMTLGTVNTDMIKIEEKTGRSTDIALIHGTVLDKSIDNSAMPHRMTKVKVLLLNDPLETMRTKTESCIDITTPEHMRLFCEQEDKDITSTVKNVIDSGARLVVSRKGISELAQWHLAKAGIMSIRRAKYNDLWWLEKSTGAKTCSSVNDISQDELGFADSVSQRSIGGDLMLFVESKSTGSVTLLLRAISKRYLDEFHRTALNAIRALANFVEDPFIVYGGGSCEAVLAKGIRDTTLYTEGKEQKVLECFADALEEIPMTLARNVGMDVLDSLPLLRSRCASDVKGWWGIDSNSRKVAKIDNVFDTCAVKQQVIKTAVETTNLILNVDDIFVRDLVDNTHCHLDGTVHAHKEPGRNHNHWEQEGLEQRQMHQFY